MNQPAPETFSNLDRDEVERVAMQNGFRRRGPRTWSRHKGEFVQVVNLQRSQWSKETTYLNFALWPLVLGEPASFSESKYQFRTRAERMSARDLPSFFEEVDRLTTLEELSRALVTRRVSGLVRKDLAALLY